MPINNSFNQIRMKKLLSLLIATTMIATACTSEVAEDVDQSDETLKIVTTIAPLYSLTANIVKDVEGVELTNIVPPNTSVHSYSLTPETAKQISEADIIVINGLELEEFLEDTLSDSDAVIVDTSEGVEFHKYEDEHDEDDHEYDEDEHDHHHGEYDPHIWLSPMNAKIQAANIQAAIVELDAENSVRYEANLVMLQKQLDNLNEEVASEFAELDVKPYVVFHDAYHYFEENFGIEAAAFVQEFSGQEPSPEYLAEVIDIIEDNGVEVIFAEPQFAPKLVQTLSEDYGLIVGELDPLGQSISEDAYFELIRGNLESFKSAFSE